MTALRVGSAVSLTRTVTTYIPGRMDAIVLRAGLNGTIVDAGPAGRGWVVAFPAWRDAIDVARGTAVPTPLVPASWLGGPVAPAADAFAVCNGCDLPSATLSPDSGYCPDCMASVR